MATDGFVIGIYAGLVSWVTVLLAILLIVKLVQLFMSFGGMNLPGLGGGANPGRPPGGNPAQGNQPAGGGGGAQRLPQVHGFGGRMNP